VRELWVALRGAGVLARDPARVAARERPGRARERSMRRGGAPTWPHRCAARPRAAPPPLRTLRPRRRPNPPARALRPAPPPGAEGACGGVLPSPHPGATAAPLGLHRGTVKRSSQRGQLRRVKRAACAGCRSLPLHETRARQASPCFGDGGGPGALRRASSVRGPHAQRAQRRRSLGRRRPAASPGPPASPSGQGAGSAPFNRGAAGDWGRDGAKNNRE
jgi:hypothetical protein